MEIVVVRCQLRTLGDGEKMVDLQFARRAAPLLPAQAVHAAKSEFIPQPRQKAPVVGVALRPVTTNVRRRRVGEGRHASEPL